MKRLNKKVVKLPLAVAASIGIATPFIAHTQDTNTLITDKVLVLEQTSAHDFHVSLDNVFDIVTGLQLELTLKGNAIPDVAELQAVSDDYLLTTTYNENVLTIVMTAKEELTKTGDQLEVGKLSFQSPQNAIGTLEIANASYKIITEKNESEQGDLSVPNESFVLNTKPVIEDKRESTTTIVEGSTFDPMSLVESGEIIATDAEDGEGVTITATPTAVDTSLPGVQTITYTAIDSAGETATLDIQLGIIASPYTVPPVIMGVQEYVTIVQNRPFDPKADVSAVDEKGNPVGVEVTGTLDVTTPGVYTLTYRASDRDKNTTTLTSTITVKANEKPVIHGIENTTIIVGESFDILAGVSVTDAEDGKISNEQLNIKGSVNVNIPGIYRISYEVTDSDGATTFVERIITVNERLSGMNSIPTIQAGNSTLIVGEAFDPYKGISAQDKEDGDLTDK
ncbi:MAG: immunoglobulin-like domain-containing protein, partial [Culicoidibacterales bacterium]